MKPDEIPSTTTEFWERKKMARKKKLQPEPEAEAQDPQDMEAMMAMRGDPNLRPMGRRKNMRKEKSRGGKFRNAG